MRRHASAIVVIAALAIGALAGPVAAAPSMQEVTITALTTFDGEPGTFASDLEGCETGTVEDGPVKIVFTPAPGIFAGFKVFMCEGGSSGFVLRLNARFGAGGSVGTWSVVQSSGSLDGMRGSGKLVGVPFPDGTGVTDTYSGTVVFTF